MEESEIDVAPEFEGDALDQLVGEEIEPTEFEQLTLEEIYEEGEETPTELEQLFPEEEYTVYYQESGGQE